MLFAILILFALAGVCWSIAAAAETTEGRATLLFAVAVIAILRSGNGPSWSPGTKEPWADTSTPEIRELIDSQTELTMQSDGGFHGVLHTVATGDAQSLNCTKDADRLNWFCVMDQSTLYGVNFNCAEGGIDAIDGLWLSDCSAHAFWSTTRIASGYGNTILPPNIDDASA